LRRDPAAKVATTRAKAAERRSLDSRDEDDSRTLSSSGASSRHSSRRPRTGSRRAISADPFADLPQGKLTAEIEKELGRAVQELLRVEAMQNQLCEETVARELRAASETPDDVFSKDFGKVSVATYASKKNPKRPTEKSTRVGENGSIGTEPTFGFARRTVNTPVASREDVTSLGFRRRMASSLGLRDVCDLDAVVARGQAARRAFVTHNVGIASTVASDVWEKLANADRGMLSRSDLTQDGCAGLARAADRFDPERGYKFSTYCYFWVRKAVMDSVTDCGRTIRLPRYLSQTLRDSRKTKRELETRLGRPASDSELAEASSVNVERVREWRRWSQSPLSLDQHSLGGGQGAASQEHQGALIDTVAVDAATRAEETHAGEDRATADAEADADADALRVALDEALATLLPREQFVLRHRFGLASASARALACRSEGGEVPGWLQASSTDEAEAIIMAEQSGEPGASRVLLGSLLGVSAETVRTIERRGIEKLKRPQRAGLVLSQLDEDTRAIIQKSATGDDEFASALAAAVEKADERAGGGRVFGAAAGRAAPPAGSEASGRKKTRVPDALARRRKSSRGPGRAKLSTRPTIANRSAFTENDATSAPVSSRLVSVPQMTRR
jgi:RNA polymerase sigma factor (sigma-70 family)